MSDTTTPSTDQLRFRARALRFGCLANIVLFLMMVTVIVVVFPAVARTLGLSTPNSDEAAIRAVLDAQTAAWNNGDLDGFMFGYWNDDELTFVSGDTLTKGWKATRDRYQKKYFTTGPDGKLNERGELSFTDLQVESFSPNAAMVRGRYILKLAAGTDTGRFTLALRRMQGGWKITSDHTSVECKK